VSRLSAALFTICGAGAAACAVVLAHAQGLDPLAAARSIAAASVAAMLGLLAAARR
jgi:hypothetical protein